MNNFNNVFVAIKKHCGDNENDVLDCFDNIAAQANIPRESLDFYLTCLNDIGVIKYAKNKKQIILTPLGKNRVALFMS